jgi:hypothetical protein
MLSSYLVELVKGVGNHSSRNKQDFFFFFSCLVLFVACHNVFIPGLS